MGLYGLIKNKTMKKSELKQLIKEVLSESDNQTYKKISFVRECIKNIRKTIKEIDWKKTTENERTSIGDDLQKLTELL